MDWPISWQKVKDNAGGGSGSGLPVLDLNITSLPSGDTMDVTMELDQKAIDTLREIHGKGPIVVKCNLVGTGGKYMSTVLSETFIESLSTYAGIGMLMDGFVLAFMIAIQPESLNAAYEGKWTVSLSKF